MMLVIVVHAQKKGRKEMSVRWKKAAEVPDRRTRIQEIRSWAKNYQRKCERDAHVLLVRNRSIRDLNKKIGKRTYHI